MREAELEKVWPVSPRVKAFRLRVLDEAPFAFVPGQWVNFHLPIEAKNPQRAYSIASPPDGGRSFDLAITHVPNGPGSSYFHSLKGGERLRFEGPAGRFVAREPDKTGAAFIATGTGVTPFRSIIPHVLRRGCAAEILCLLGVRTEEEILFRDEWEALAGGHPNFRFVPTLSRPAVEWGGERGYVQTHLDRLLAGKAGLEVYVCGLKMMVDEVRARLVAMGFERRRIYFEKYD